MDLTRRQIAYLVSTLYCVGGALLLFDFLGRASEPGAHLPLAWHVYPVALAGHAVTHAASFPGPLDTDWPVSIHTVVATFIPSAIFCAVAMVWLISGHTAHGAQESGD